MVCPLLSRETRCRPYLALAHTFCNIDGDEEGCLSGRSDAKQPKHSRENIFDRRSVYLKSPSYLLIVLEASQNLTHAEGCKQQHQALISTPIKQINGLIKTINNNLFYLSHTLYNFRNVYSPLAIAIHSLHVDRSGMILLLYPQIPDTDLILRLNSLTADSYF